MSGSEEKYRVNNRGGKYGFGELSAAELLGLDSKSDIMERLEVNRRHKICSITCSF